MLEPDWVAEEPELHLLPHIRRACAQRGWAVSRADVRDAVLEVDVDAPGAPSPIEAAFVLLGTFAESSTHVVVGRHDVGVAAELEATTGVLDGDSAFAPHGHVVRLSVRTG